MASRIYWAKRLDQLQALTNPVRHDIVDRLTALGPLSVRELAQALGRRPTAIYRYIQTLEDVGLICRVASPVNERGRPPVIDL